MHFYLYREHSKCTNKIHGKVLIIKIICSLMVHPCTPHFSICRDFKSIVFPSIIFNIQVENESIFVLNYKSNTKL